MKGWKELKRRLQEIDLSIQIKTAHGDCLYRLSFYSRNVPFWKLHMLHNSISVNVKFSGNHTLPKSHLWAFYESFLHHLFLSICLLSIYLKKDFSRTNLLILSFGCKNCFSSFSLLPILTPPLTVKLIKYLFWQCVAGLYGYGIYLLYIYVVQTTWPYHLLTSA